MNKIQMKKLVEDTALQYSAIRFQASELNIDGTNYFYSSMLINELVFQMKILKNKLVIYAFLFCIWTWQGDLE